MSPTGHGASQAGHTTSKDGMNLEIDSSSCGRSRQTRFSFDILYSSQWVQPRQTSSSIVTQHAAHKAKECVQSRHDPSRLFDPLQSYCGQLKQTRLPSSFMHSLETVVDPIEADILLIFDTSVCPSHQGVRSKQEMAPNNSLQSTVNLLWPVNASRSRHD